MIQLLQEEPVSIMSFPLDYYEDCCFIPVFAVVGIAIVAVVAVVILCKREYVKERLVSLCCYM